MTKAWLRVELAVLFIALPLGFRFKPFPFPPIPALWLVTVYCLYRLIKDPNFDRTLLWNPAALAKFLPKMLFIFVPLALLIGILVLLAFPQKLFNIVRSTPLLWAVVMVLYPPLSVYPQSIVYRAFLFHRYQDLFPNPYARIVMSAILFSFVHIIFRNAIAVIFTLIGGVLFALRYYESRSLFTSTFEHALYGCWMFTIGLGEFFYRGMR